MDYNDISFADCSCQREQSANSFGAMPSAAELGFYQYGKQVELKEPWRGYHRGTIIAQTIHGFIVEFSSGAQIEVSRDEVEFD